MKNEKTIFVEPSLLLLPLTKTDILTTSSDTEMSEVEDEE